MVSNNAYENHERLHDELAHLRNLVIKERKQKRRMENVVAAARKDVYDEHPNTDRVKCMCAVCLAIRELDDEP